jgi:hypothetical protein
MGLSCPISMAFALSARTDLSPEPEGFQVSLRPDELVHIWDKSDGIYGMGQSQVLFLLH